MPKKGQFNPDYGFGAYGDEVHPGFIFARPKTRRRYKKQVYRRLRRLSKKELYKKLISL